MILIAVRVLLLSSCCVYSQYVPASPCPDIFSYKSDGLQMYGVIRYQPPGQSKYIFMRADFAIRAALPKGYPTGRLEVEGSEEAVLLRMLRGQSLDYRVDFPLTSPLPTLTAITINHGQVICSGEPESGSASKSYSLEHLLFDKGDSPSVLALNIDNSARSQPSQPTLSSTKSHTPAPSPIQLAANSSEVECGLVSGGNGQVELVFLGRDVSPGEWPWLVAIFAKARKSIDYICTGSLVSNKHVITAGHCMKRRETVTALSGLVLKLGAFNLNNTDDPRVVTRGVKFAAIHFYYDPYTLANDLLVLVLDSPVTFTSSIRPVCLWEGAIDLNLIIGKHGTVVGWGGNELYEAGTGEPRQATLPVVSTETCRGTRKEFHDLTSRTTMCLGYRNGTGPCNGDSGGGLYMLSGGRWRLRGLVSVSLRPATGEAKCNLQEYVVFTDVAQYLSWVRTQLAGMPVPSQGPKPTTTSSIRTPAPSAAVELDIPCGVVSGGNEYPEYTQDNPISPASFPWLVAIYDRFNYLCAGTLISKQHVIIDNLCVSYYGRKDIETLRLVLGPFNLERFPSTDTPNKDFGLGFVKINSTALPRKFHNSAPFVNNILIMKLDEPVIFSDRVRPVCLWEGDTNHELIVGQHGMVVGWIHEADIVGEGPPKATSVRILPDENCRPASNKSLHCAGDYYNKFYTWSPYYGDSLYMLTGGRWRLRGLVTGSSRYHYEYTDVAPFVSWIREHTDPH